MKFIKIKEENSFANVTLNRPDMRNAFNPEMIEEIRSTFSDLGKRADLRAIILRGEGKVFCAGGDLNWLKDMVRYSPEENRQDAYRLFEMFETVFNCAVPVIGVVHGSAFGGALGLIASCDYVICEEKTQLCFSEVKLGISPAVISAFVLRKCSMGAVTPFMMMGQSFDAKTGKTIGLIHDIADEESLPDRVEITLSWLRETGPEAVRATKLLLHGLGHLNWTEIKEETAEVISERRVSAEGQEGLKSFLEKRKASWKVEE